MDPSRREKMERPLRDLEPDPKTDAPWTSVFFSEGAYRPKNGRNYQPEHTYTTSQN